jgi:hypothetical protein
MSLKARYERRAKDREQFLQRARHNALLTLPSLIPLEGQDGKNHLVEPYQGLGALAITHLSSRITVGLLPAGRPFMRLDVPAQVKLQSQGVIPVEAQKQMSLVEGMIQSEVEQAGWRTATLQSVLQLVVAGNVLEYLMPDNRLRLYRLDQFTVRRDVRGDPIEIIIMEKFPRDAAPVEATSAIAVTDENFDEEVELYTMIRLHRTGNAEFYERTQEWGGGETAGAPTVWPKNEMPYNALRWASTPGEDYGRAKVEEHAADLRSLDALEKAGLEMAGMGSRNFVMVRPGAQASSIKNRLVRALNGDVLIGDPDSVELKSFVNQAGFQITQTQVEALSQRLGRAFLLTSAGQRDAERVTATEIERDIQEIESALGGTFSSLAQDMMEMRTELLMGNMKTQEKLPPFQQGDLVPTILTGLEALSRERDVGRAMQAANVTQAFGDAAADVVKADVILGRAFIGLGFPDAVRSEKEVAGIRKQNQEQAQQQQLQSDLVGKVAPGVAQELAKKGE